MIGIDVLPGLLESASVPLSFCNSLRLRKQAVMKDHDPKQTRGELIQLLNKQLGTLEKETFGGLTTTERREYEVRRERIHQLYDEFARQTVLGYEGTPPSIKGF
jgi:hypothetical protein